jgi:AcrR family transcriptional regulator
LEHAGVGRVCKRARVSRRTFYELFDDRETCFTGVVDAAIEQLSGPVHAAYETNGRWRERIRAALTVLLECFEQDRALARVCLIETLKGGPEVLERRRRTLETLATALEQGRAEAKDGNAPPALTAQGIVGGVVSVLHAHIAQDDVHIAQEERESLIELLNPLMSVIVLPYLGPAAARRELQRTTPKPTHPPNTHSPAYLLDPFKDLPIRLTFRTARVLETIGTHPGASNRRIGEQAGVSDQGQISKLLKRLQDNGLIENNGEGHAKGDSNAWQLTQRGNAIQHAIHIPTT